MNLMFMKWVAFRRLLPASLFGRLSFSLVLLSAGLVVFSGWLFYRQTFEKLDQEASQRLLEAAQQLAADVKQVPLPEKLDLARVLFRNRFASGRGMGWIQNAYWVSFSEKKPVFLASFSAQVEKTEMLQPPSVEDVEDMIDEDLLLLEDGNPVFPDPFSLVGTRRFKIVLVPILDEVGVLTGVIGLEADFQYLTMPAAVQGFFLKTIGLAVPICVIISMLLAGSLSRRVEKLVDDLSLIAERRRPSEGLTGIVELDTLKNGLVQFGEIIQARDRQLRVVFEEKLQELSFTGSAIAHEIRNPLSAMEMHLGLIRRRFSPSGEDLESFMEIQEQMGFMKVLIENFLSYSRLVTPQKTLLNPRTVIEEVLKTKKTAIAPFSDSLEIPESFTMRFDPGMFRQVVENLVNNALEAKPRELVLTVKGSATAGWKRLEFLDNGPGVPEDLVPRLFTPFATGKVSGHGIGLALVKKLVEAHNGTIVHAREEGGGARFVLEVPE